MKDGRVGWVAAARCGKARRSETAIELMDEMKALGMYADDMTHNIVLQVRTSVHVCMHVRTCACVRVCMCACTHVHAYFCAFVCVRACVRCICLGW